MVVLLMVHFLHQKRLNAGEIHMVECCVANANVVSSSLTIRSMQERLEKLGLRVEGDFTLHSGAKASVKWDIEKLHSDYALHERLFYLRPWHREILKFIRGRDILIVGVPTGGYYLAMDFAEHYKLRYAHPKYHLNESSKKWNAIVIDDVLTTGTTVKEYFDKVHVLAVAVLVNRSKLTKINNKPIISGFFADEVNTVS